MARRGLKDPMQQPDLKVLEPKLAQALRDSTPYVPWLNRDLLIRQLQKIGIPRPRSERWKYQNPKPLLDALLTAPTGRTELAGEGADITPLNAVERRQRLEIEAGLSTVFRQSSLSLLNGILFSEGWYVEIEEETGGELRLAGISDSIECVFVKIGPKANLSVYDDVSGGNHTIYYDVAPDAKVEIVRLQRQECATESREVRVSLSAGSALDYRVYGLGTAFRSNEVVVDCRGEGANAKISGVWRTEGREDVNQHFTVNHLVPECTSEQTYRSILVDESRSVFNGRIYINTGARKTEAHLECRSITIGELAETYAKPELAIFNDDVVCSHGVTAGPLDPEVSFYLQSRGIPQSATEEILIKGFLRELAPDVSGRDLLHLN